MTAVPPRPFPAQPNPKKKNVRIVFNVERAIVAEEFNDLRIKLGEAPRDVTKLRLALKHSLFCVTARKLKSRELVGLVRACGDGVFNAELLDLMAYPPGSEAGEAIKKQMLLRFKREIRRSMPKCAISTFALPADLVLFLRASFEKDPDGIRAMSLPQGGWSDEAPVYPEITTNLAKANPSPRAPQTEESNKTAI